LWHGRLGRSFCATLRGATLRHLCRYGPPSGYRVLDLVPSLLWPAVVLFSQFLNGPTRFHTIGPVDCDVVFGHWASVVVVPLDEQPVRLVRVLAAANADQNPSPTQFFAVQLELESSLEQTLMWIAVRNPDAAVPHDHLAAAVFALWNDAFKLRVFQRMIFH